MGATPAVTGQSNKGQTSDNTVADDPHPRPATSAGATTRLPREAIRLRNFLRNHDPGPAQVRLAWAAALMTSAIAGWLSIHQHDSRVAKTATGAHITLLGTFGLYALNALIRANKARAAAQQDAAASHNQLQDLIDNTKSNIYMKRIDNGQYLLVNKEWERLFGVSRHQVVDLTDHGVFPPDLADQLRANDLHVAATGTSLQYEETADSSDGVRTYISVKFPVLDSTGNPYAVCGISTDITDRKRAEDEVRSLNANLETRVLQRTAELEASTRELDAFAYSVSHDLRAPLRSLHGFSEALLDDYGDQLDDVGKDYLARLQRNVGRMGRMIDDLLNLSRATRVELERCDVDLSAMAHDILTDLQTADPTRAITLMVPGGLTTQADPHLLRIALHNLLANAWKFTGKRADPVIELGSTRRDGETYFYIRDNGVGFDMTYAGKLFDAFQRLHTTADFEGTGIGLAIVARIVRRHGGRIFAEAEVDHGATFYFDLMTA